MGYVDTLMKKSRVAPRKVVKHTYTLELLRALDTADLLGEGPFMKPERFWKEATEGYAASKLAPKGDYDLIIDAGTGVGLAAYYAAKCFPRARVVGVDPRDAPTRKAMWRVIKRVAPNTDFKVAKIEDMEDKIARARKPLIIGVHNCRELSIIDLEIAARTGADVLLIPCCASLDELKKRGIDTAHLGILTGTDELNYYRWVVGLATYAQKLGFTVETGASGMLRKITNRYAYIRAKTTPFP